MKELTEREMQNISTGLHVCGIIFCVTSWYAVYNGNSYSNYMSLLGMLFIVSACIFDITVRKKEISTRNVVIIVVSTVVIIIDICEILNITLSKLM